VSATSKLEIIEEAEAMAHVCGNCGLRCVAVLLLDLAQVVEARGRRIRDLTAELRKYQRSALSEVKAP